MIKNHGDGNGYGYGNGNGNGKKIPDGIFGERLDGVISSTRNALFFDLIERI